MELTNLLEIMVDILTLNYNDSLTTISFVEKVKPYKIVSRIIIVDNNSSDDSYEILSNIVSDRIILLRSPRNGGYGAGNNYGIRYAQEHLKSKYVLLSNPDVIIEEEAVVRLFNHMKGDQGCAIAAPFMCDSSGNKLQNTAFRVPTLWQYALSLNIVISKFHTPMRYKNLNDTLSESLKVGCVSGSCFMLDVDKFIAVDGFDENIFLYCEEVVLGHKMKNAGYDVILLPQVTFIHHHSVSISKSIRSAIARQKQLYDSKLYVLKEYYKVSPLGIMLLRLCAKFSLFVLYIRESIRSSDAGI